jgi:hypothetical protein
MSVTAEVDRIRHMLDDGLLTQMDEAGHQHELRARCPTDDVGAPVYRVSRSGQRVIEVVFRCPSCGQDFSVSPEQMHLA